MKAFGILLASSFVLLLGTSATYSVPHDLFIDRMSDEGLGAGPSIEISNPLTDPSSQYVSGPFRYFPKVIGLPQGVFQNQVLPGLAERARAVEEITADLYGEQKLLDEFPHWRRILAAHSGFWPEFVGQDHAGRRRLHDRYFARLYGPDLRWIPDSTHADGFNVVVGAENSGNVRGGDWMQLMTEAFKKRSDWGALPHNEDIFRRWAEHIYRLANFKDTSSAPKLVVLADEASALDQPVAVENENGEMVSVKPPYAVGAEMLDFMRERWRAVGIEYVSLVDDRSRLTVDNERVLWLWDTQRKEKRRVDVLWTMADLESIDPKHKPQVERNIRADKPELNQNALLMGVPSLIEAWLANRFIWINNPTSTLTRSKLAQVMIDEFITKRQGRAPILAAYPTTVFYNPDGTLNEAALEQVKKSPRDWVYKFTMRGGLSQVTIGRELSEAALQSYLSKFEVLARENPFSVAAQPVMNTDLLPLQWPESEMSDPRVYDTILFTLISQIPQLGADTPAQFEWTANRFVLVRLAAPGQLKIGLRRTGVGAIAVPYDVPRPQALPPLADIGAKQVTHSFVIPADRLENMKIDAANNAKVEAEVVREVYRHPDRLIRDFPTMGPLMKKLFWNRVHYHANRKSMLPIIFLSGPDYMEFESGGDSQEDARVEGNTTNVGGLFRLWKRSAPGVKAEIAKWFAQLKKIDPAPDHYMVYLLEEINLGGKWSDVQSKFFEDFGIHLVTASDVKNFQIRDNFLFYQPPGGDSRRVTTLFAHIEPDFIDPEGMPADEDLSFIHPHELADKRRHGIPGLFKVVQAGNILMVNEPGVDIACCKALLPYAPALHERYLGEPERVRTQPTYGFHNEFGLVDPASLDRVQSDPERYVVKDVLSIGNGGGVFILRDLSPSAREIILEDVRAEPWRFVAQEVGVAAVNSLGFHTETRWISLVKVDLNSDVPAELIGQIDVPYGRGANMRARANILPNGNADPGIIVPIVAGPSRCRAELDRTGGAQLKIDP